MSEWLGATWSSAGFVALTALAMYVSIVVAVRIAGRRTLSQLSAFDAVVTIALGSMLATTILSRDVSYLEGVTGVVTLISLQVVVGALRRRFDRLRRVLDFEPVVLIEDSVEKQRTGLFGAQMTDTELRSALRARGIFDPSEVKKAILEPNGEISALRRDDSGT